MKAFDKLGTDEANRIRTVASTMQNEAIAHVGRRLNEALEPLPAEGPITLDAEWLRTFVERRDVSQINTDYLFTRAVGALDKKGQR